MISHPWADPETDAQMVAWRNEHLSWAVIASRFSEQIGRVVTKDAAIRRGRGIGLAAQGRARPRRPRRRYAPVVVVGCRWRLCDRIALCLAPKGGAVGCGRGGSG